MKLFEEFSLYENMWDSLTEAKADTQRLIDFAGEELASRFLNIKNKVKSPENDLYYWIKNKTPEELEQFITEIETAKSATSLKKEVADEGAKLVCETEHWKVYNITTFEASQKYGRDTKWCITGINGWGDRYWKEYKENGIDFYFLITKGEYDPRGKFSKVAIATASLTTGDYSCEVFNQQDTPIPLKQVPYIEEIKIPGLDLSTISNQIVCFECGATIDGDIYYGPQDECFCKYCFNTYYFKCTKCNKTTYADITCYEDEHDNKFCSDCCSYGDLLKKASDGVWYIIRSEKPYKYFEGIVTSKKQAYERFTRLKTLVEAAANTTKIDLIDVYTGEVLFANDHFDDNILADLLKTVDTMEELA